jgi:hypothetical protein
MHQQHERDPSQVMVIIGDCHPLREQNAAPVALCKERGILHVVRYVSAEDVCLGGMRSTFSFVWDKIGRNETEYQCARSKDRLIESGLRTVARKAVSNTEAPSCEEWIRRNCRGGEDFLNAILHGRRV